MIPHHPSGRRRHQRHQPHGRADQQCLRDAPGDVRHDRAGHREQPGDPGDAPGGRGGAVQDGRVHQVREHEDGGEAARHDQIHADCGRPDEQRGARPGPAQQLAAGGHGKREQDCPLVVGQRDWSVVRPVVEPDTPQEQPTEQTAPRDPHVVAVRAGESSGRGSIQQGARVPGVLLRDGLWVRRRMRLGCTGTRTLAVWTNPHPRPSAKRGPT